jgi:hypothetical protein
MNFITVKGAWYVNTDQFAKLGFDKSLVGKFKINIARIDYVENWNELENATIYYIIKLADGSCIVTKETDFLKELK